MESKYDQKAWEQETELGRRLYIHNFGMTGNEFAGWELIKITVMDNTPDVSEKIYMWKHKKSKAEELVQVGIIESNYWRHAQQHLYTQLANCMRPDIPRGKAKTASIGDIQHVGQEPSTNLTAAVFFTRGNLQINVRSVGAKPVDVVALAKSLDNRLIKPLIKTDEKKLTATRQKPLKIIAKKGEMTVLIETLPEPTPRSGWTKVLAEGGELRKEGDTLYLVDEKAGEKTVEIVNFKLD
jgi:hypothetical protein